MFTILLNPPPHPKELACGLAAGAVKVPMPEQHMFSPTFQILMQTLDHTGELHSPLHQQNGKQRQGPTPSDTRTRR